MSLPMATADWPAATAEAEPPDEPPGTLSVSHGFRVTCSRTAAVLTHSFFRGHLLAASHNSGHTAQVLEIP